MNLWSICYVVLVVYAYMQFTLACNNDNYRKDDVETSPKRNK